MNLNANKFALASTYATAIIWVVCSILVLAIPGLSMHASGYMMHSDFTAAAWQMGLTGFLVGLILWSVTAVVFSWLLATFYNKLL